MVLELHRLSHGLELVRVTTIGMQQIQPQYVATTVGILRNKATGDEQALAISVEPQAPHRITGLPILHPSLIATLVRPAASVALSEGEQLQEIGAYLKRLADADIFSGVVVITRDGQPVFSQAYWLCRPREEDREHAVHALSAGQHGQALHRPRHRSARRAGEAELRRSPVEVPPRLSGSRRARSGSGSSIC